MKDTTPIPQNHPIRTGACQDVLPEGFAVSSVPGDGQDKIIEGLLITVSQFDDSGKSDVLGWVILKLIYSGLTNTTLPS